MIQNQSFKIDIHKNKLQHLYSATCHLNSAVHHRQEPAFSVGHSRSTQPDYGHCGHAATLNLSLWYNGVHLRNSCIYTHLPIQEGWKAELTLLADT